MYGCRDCPAVDEPDISPALPDQVCLEEEVSGALICFSLGVSPAGRKIQTTKLGL